MKVGEVLAYFDCEYVRLVNANKAILTTRYNLTERMKELEINTIDIHDLELVLNVEPFKIIIETIF